MATSGSHRPRVVLLHYTSPPVVGGVETVLAHQARHLARQGYDVDVLTGRGGSLGAGVRVRRLALLDSRHPRVLAVTHELEEGRVTARFAALVRRIQTGLERVLRAADTCIVHNALTLHKNLALTAALHEVAARGLLPRTFAWCHDLAWTNPRYRAHLHAGHPWVQLRTPIRSVTYVTVSHERRRDLCAALRVPPGSVEVIPNGIDPGPFLRLTPVGQWLAETLRLWEQDVVLLLPARITRRKRIEYALAVVAEMVRRELTVRLVITGPPGAHNPRNQAYLEELRAARRRMGLDEQVIFCAELQHPAGRTLALSRRALTDLYLLADALLLPSGDEGFGLPLLEAGLLRLPAFTSDLPPFRAIGHDAIHTFAPEDPPARVAARIVHTLMEEPDYRFRRRVLATYTWEAVMREHIVPLLGRGTAAARP